MALHSTPADPRLRGVALTPTAAAACSMGKPPSVRGLVWITPPGAPRRGQGPAADGSRVHRVI